MCRGQKTAPECHSLSTMGARGPTLVLRLWGKHCYLPSRLSSPRGSGYKILPFACGDNLASLFSNIDVLYLFCFSCLIALVRTSSAMFNKKSESWYLSIFQDFREKAFCFSPCAIMLAVALYRAWFCYSALSLYLTCPTYLSQRNVGVPQTPLPASTPAIRPLFLYLLHSILSICCITFPSFVNSSFLTSPAWSPTSSLWLVVICSNMNRNRHYRVKSDKPDTNR